MVSGKRRPDKMDRRAADLARLDGQIGQVAVVRAHRIVAPVLRPGRVPVRAGAREVGRRALADAMDVHRSEEHTSELQSLMRTSYAVFCLKKKNRKSKRNSTNTSKLTHMLTRHTNVYK